jgi:hypothetical protein
MEIYGLLSGAGDLEKEGCNPNLEQFWPANRLSIDFPLRTFFFLLK